MRFHTGFTRPDFCRGLAAAMLTAALSAAPALAQTGGEKQVTGAEAIGAKVTERYGLTVLSVTRPAGLPVGLVQAKVMNPGGNSNGAFQVYTILVDPVTGERVVHQ